MAKTLKLLLCITGGTTLVLFLMPGLIIYAGLALIIPGLILALVPTVFFYIAIFSAAWFALRRFSTSMATLAGIIAVAAVAIAVPNAINTQTQIALDEAARRDVHPRHVIAPTQTIAIEQTKRSWLQDACDDLCQLLLYNRAATAVIAVPPPDDGTKKRAPAYPTLFRIEHREVCDPAAKHIGRDNAGAWTDEAPSILKAVRMRIAAGDCLIATSADGAKADLTIRRVEEGTLSSSGHLWPRPGTVETNAIEIAAADTLIARGSEHRATMIDTPLYLEPYGYGLDLKGWEWGRRTPSQSKLNVRALLARFTTFDTAIPKGTDPAQLRQRIDAALDDPTLPADNAAFALTQDYYDIMRNDGLQPGDAERLARMIADDRVTLFWFFPYKAIKAADAVALYRDPLLDRLPRAAAAGPYDTYHALEQLAGSLPEGAFRDAGPRLDALLADRDVLGRSEDLIPRIADRGASAIPLLLDIMRQGWAKPERGEKNREGGKAARAAVRGFCLMGDEARSALPALQKLASDGIVPRGLQENDDWRIMLIKLGADVESFEKPSNRRGPYHRSLRRRAEKGCGL